MAIVAFMFSSIVGTLTAFVLWFAFGLPITLALAVYLATSLALGLALIAMSMWQPPSAGLRLRPA